MASLWHRTLRTVGKAFGRKPTPIPAVDRGVDHTAGPTVDHTVGYDAERLGLPPLRYAPHPDDLPDPGEVVWTWVPYEDDPQQGKDRPVLVLARIGDSAVVIQMTSKDHDRDAAQEAHWGRHWMDIGSGDWDSRHRASEVRLDRLLQVPLKAVRRTGGALDEERYNSVIAELRRYHA
ncbi:hypothetical protein GCM10011575_29280 [Microlunatus endophyticus]|uniref:PemK-like, MazF-like toxin of type II toxin-antitoxin system n=1 Tax=Microlunatus endophyticus TaxID=1716077 RepID=A0A917SAV9_9ACTN|nr:type II toxin-antitoxin system PemK/MazF family toxin [Microlunatus endophyticus]GGL68790.1 hypothetical protein GCM10011575_29280 [Microlunatus endophyticus]